MRCDHYQFSSVKVPDGFALVPYQPGYEKAWAQLEYEIGDFDSTESAEQYFITTYLADPRLWKNLIFAIDQKGAVVGSCIAWHDIRGDHRVPSLHWLIVSQRHQGKGLGRALCQAVMKIFVTNFGFPVYIHTQPWSWKAILLYISLGFKMQSRDTFATYDNDYDSAMTVLKQVLSERDFALLQKNTQA